MHNLHEIERYVLEGFVLDWNGNWRPVNEVVEEESDYLHHLENGEIVNSGNWVKIDDLLKTDSPEATSEYKEAETKLKHDLLETKVIKDNLEKAPDSEDNALLDEIRGEIEEVLDIDAEKTSPAVKDSSKKENQKQVVKSSPSEKKESAEKETREIEAVKDSQKTEAPTEVLKKKVDSFETALPKEEPKDNGDLDTKSLRIAKTEETPVSQGGSSDAKKTDTSSEWDQAQSIVKKLVIIPIAAVIVIAIIIIVIALF